MQIDNLLKNVRKHIILTASEVEHFASLLNEKNLARKEVLLEPGQRCDTFNYVNSGALRAFYRKDDDKEATIMFAVSDWWITDMTCFVSQEPSQIYIEAITKSNVIQLRYEEMDDLYKRIPSFERFFRILMQNAYIREQKRILQSLSMTADARYADFLKKYPLIAREVTQKNIASYLGITPEFLSVIRAKRTKGDIS